MEGFQPYQDESQFVIAAGHFAKRAADEVLACRKKFSLLPAVAEYLCRIENKTEWDHCHAAIALALSGIQRDAEQLKLKTVWESLCDYLIEAITGFNWLVPGLGPPEKVVGAVPS